MKKRLIAIILMVLALTTGCGIIQPSETPTETSTETPLETPAVQKSEFSANVCEQFQNVAIENASCITAPQYDATLVEAGSTILLNVGNVTELYANQIFEGAYTLSPSNVLTYWVSGKKQSSLTFVKESEYVGINDDYRYLVFFNKDQEILYTVERGKLTKFTGIVSIRSLCSNFHEASLALNTVVRDTSGKYMSISKNGKIQLTTDILRKDIETDIAAGRKAEFSKGLLERFLELETK